MKHSNFYNKDCKYCRAINAATWLTLSLLSIFIIMKAHDVAWTISIMFAFIVVYFSRNFMNRVIPQSHGYLFDVTGEQEWYKPKK